MGHGHQSPLLLNALSLLRWPILRQRQGSCLPVWTSFRAAIF
jgi:hypothetical protein